MSATYQRIEQSQRDTHEHKRLLSAAIRAFEKAASRLKVKPADLAEALSEGELADLIIGCSEAGKCRMYGPADSARHHIERGLREVSKIKARV